MPGAAPSKNAFIEIPVRTPLRLFDRTISDAAVYQGRPDAILGPAVRLAATAGVEIRTSEAITLRDGFSVVRGALLTLEIDAGVLAR